MQRHLTKKQSEVFGKRLRFHVKDVSRESHLTKIFSYILSRNYLYDYSIIARLGLRWRYQDMR